MKRLASVIILFSLPCAVFSASGVEDYATRRSETAPFVFIYPPRLSSMADAVEDILAGSFEEIAVAVGLARLDTVTVYIAGDDKTYRSLHGGLVPEWGIAYSRRDRREIGIDAGAVLRTPKPLGTVIKHELSHIVFTERVAGAPCPTWFVEGLAMMQSHEWSFEDQWGLVSSVWKKRLPSIEDLGGSFPHGTEDATLAYRVSYYAVDELLRGRPEDLVTFTSFIRDLGDFDRAFLLTFGESPLEYSERMHVQIVNRYATAAVLMRSMPYWGILSILMIFAYLLKRMRARRKLREWESGRDGTSFLF
jgi:hypothetical protein